MSGIQNVAVSAAQTFATVAPQAQQSLQPFANLDLTEAQRTQLRSIFTAAKQSGAAPDEVKKQVDAVLNPTQQKTLAGDIKGHRGHGAHHRHFDSDASSGATTSDASQQNGASASSTVLGAVTNVQNQVSAANSARLDTLQHNVLAGTDTTNTSPTTTS